VGTPLAAVATRPYFRDDSCVDDGTGMHRGPKLHLRSATEPSTWGYDPVTGIPVSPAPAGATQVFQRRCWNHHPDGTPYNIPGATFFDPTNAAELPDPIPDPGLSPQGDLRYYQGDLGTHGLHILFITHSDNAQLPEPVAHHDGEPAPGRLRRDSRRNGFTLRSTPATV